MAGKILSVLRVVWVTMMSGAESGLVHQSVVFLSLIVGDLVFILTAGEREEREVLLLIAGEKQDSLEGFEAVHGFSIIEDADVAWGAWGDGLYEIFHFLVKFPCGFTVDEES